MFFDSKKIFFFSIRLNKKIFFESKKKKFFSDSIKKKFFRVKIKKILHRRILHFQLKLRYESKNLKITFSSL